MLPISLADSLQENVTNMALKIRIHGFKYVERMLRSKKMQLGKGVQSVLVGYGEGGQPTNASGVPYAVHVHEDLEARHDPGKQAKFLTEAPFTKDELAEIVTQSLKKGETLIEGLEKAGQLVLERSEPLVPVDTYALVESGFVRREVGDD